MRAMPKTELDLVHLDYDASRDASLLEVYSQSHNQTVMKFWYTPTGFENGRFAGEAQFIENNVGEIATEKLLTEVSKLLAANMTEEDETLQDIFANHGVEAYGFKVHLLRLKSSYR